ncbi:BAG family molecular chaperone regulator 2-like [Rhodamnia argentea]|uniref:BAG family molecular chaperone regulator 2-like n=1 Tax=Rhodamnia argentea TaxID=178133 RepID=A0A8B8MYQ0_9MYRT|nr:BAG family molecular chaperone regulator 2-like [Rhodamnia argentea]XP_048141091.1 BAG family molecular chaperone regulator 2-like [Rhodamnia argentea]XP_048141092.1 BAG family molecular chaperone regulator 2-like [Rhodamnia argentea]
MMKRRSNVYARTRESSAAATAATTTSSSSATSRDEEVEWEVRPGGMLVQKRTENSGLPAPNVRVRVAHGAIRHEISMNSEATFGELKKLLAAETGLQAGEQRLVFRGKERDDGEYLDSCGVKDRSKVNLIQDPISIERRLVEMRRNAKIQTVRRAISDVAAEVDKLADQVSAIEKSIAKGNKVPDVQITTLIEMLMRQAIKLDGIFAEGDAASLKNLQGKRVQKCVETLDVLKVSNARIKPVIVTTKWETFDHPPEPPGAVVAATATNPWEFFD